MSVNIECIHGAVVIGEPKGLHQRRQDVKQRTLSNGQSSNGVEEDLVGEFLNSALGQSCSPARCGALPLREAIHFLKARHMAIPAEPLTDATPAVRAAVRCGRPSVRCSRAAAPGRRSPCGVPCKVMTWRRITPTSPASQGTLIEEGFAALVGPSIGEMWWSSLIWPDVPDHGVHGEADNARVSLLFNCRTQSLDGRSDDHSVLVHVRRGNRDGSEERHASWPAEQIGQSVIGPSQE